MLEMVNDRRNGDMKEERYDLFSGLLDAAQEEPESGPAISDQELMGESFLLIRIRCPYSMFQETCLFLFLLDMR
jgi:cytochrome P450